jgi:hypothetical protein
METVLIEAGRWFRPFQFQTAMAIIATLLVVFGQDINLAVKRVIGKQHLIIRTLIFVLVCAFGYGLLTVWLTGVLAQQLYRIPDIYIVPFVVTIFITLGIYAQKHRHI